MIAIQRTHNQLTLDIRVSPNAKRSGFEGFWNNTHIKIALKAPPVDGKANEALISFLSDFLSIRKSAITLLSGQTNRLKRVSIMCASETEVEQRIKQLSQNL